MKRRLPLTETCISLWTILSAGVLAVLVLACVGAAAGATYVVDDDGGAGVDYTMIQAVVDAASGGDTTFMRRGDECPRMRASNWRSGEKSDFWWINNNINNET